MKKQNRAENRIPAWRRALLCLAAVCLLVLPLRTGEGRAQRKLTLMVYLCGSNLESAYGSATADLQEMLESGLDPEQVTLLVMAGGSSRWSNGLDAQESVILEIRGGKQRIVWREGARSMGEGATLSTLLRFGREFFPAEDYALILWDHGAGPLEGICWDEMFSMDRLTLEELTWALTAAEYPEKLKWIGFDACLMGDAEVACAMAPWAEYMIASQETEPARGWNYRFLGGIAEDATGADTGRRIVDAYFEGAEEHQDQLTMACIDLSAMAELTEEMDRFFTPVTAELDSGAFRTISGIRLAAEGFGQVIRAAGDEGYDLVDLGDLISRYGESAGALRQALEKAVVCSRSTTGTASGLSVYHPYVNKEKYRETWGSGYRKLQFSRGYQQYVERFGTLLTGEVTVRWSGLQTVEEETGAAGTHFFSLPLSAEQLAGLASAELIILERVDRGWTDTISLSPVSAEIAEIGAYGLRGSYRNRALYAVSGEGETLAGPISFLRSGDGNSYYVLGAYKDYSGRNGGRDDVTILFEMTLNPETMELEPLRSYVYDTATQSYTNRIPFTEEGMTDLEFHLFIRNMPADVEEIPGFDQWDPYGGYLARFIRLPMDWKLQFSENWQGRELYAMFQVTDLQQNTYSSIPVRLRNLSDRQAELSPAETEAEGVLLRWEIIRNTEGRNPQVRIRMEAENRTGTDLSVSGSEYVLNGRRMTSSGPYLSELPAGGTQTDERQLQSEDILGLEELTSVDLALHVSPKDGEDEESRAVQVHLEVSGCSLEGVSAPMPETLAETRTGETEWRLLSLEQNDQGEFSGLLYLRNDSEEPLYEEVTMLAEGVRAGWSWSVSADPGLERIIPFSVSNSDTVSRFRLRTAGRDQLYALAVTQAAERAGVSEIRQVELWRGMSDSWGKAGEPIRLELKTPLKLRAPEEPAPELTPILEGAEGVEVQLESVYIADNGVGLGLRIRNDTEKTVFLQAMLPAVGEGFLADEFDPYDGIVLPPHTRAVKCFSVSGLEPDPAPGDPAEEVRFRFRIGNRTSTEAVLRLPAGTAFGAEKGTLLGAGEIIAEPAVMDERPMALAEEVRISDGEFRPILRTAPLTAAEAEGTESGSAWICLLGEESIPGQEGKTGRTTRNLTGTSLRRNDRGEWEAAFSGAALRLREILLTTKEDPLEENLWTLNPDTVYLYAQETEITPDMDLYFDTEADFTSRGYLTVRAKDGRILPEEYALELSPEDWNDERTNCDLEEVAMAAVETRIYFGTDRMHNYNTIDYNRNETLKMDGTLTPELIPVTEAGGTLGLYYVIFGQDGSRDDILADFETGEILERTHLDP